MLAVYANCAARRSPTAARFAPTTSEPGHVVTNGMSQYSRNERNANAAIVVGIEPDDFTSFDASGSPLAGIALQRALETHAYVLGGENYSAPAQLVGDFIAGRAS